MHAKGQVLLPGMYISYSLQVNIGKFGLSYFRECATDFPEASRLAKFGPINRFMEMN